MRKLIQMTAALLLAVGGVSTAVAADGIYVGGSATGYFLDSDRTIKESDKSLVGGINLGYRFFNDWALEAGIGRDITGDDLDVAKLDFLYWFGEDNNSWRPYFVAGLSYFDRDDLTNLWPDEENTHQFGAGLGISNMFSDHWEFRSDVRILHKVREGQDGTNDAALNVALNYYFNAPAPAPVAAEPAPAPAPQTRTITVRLNVEFEFDKDVVRAIYGDELEAVANAMKAHDDIELMLEGHTDYKGSDAYNQDLSERRAAAVKAKLVEMYGLEPSRVSTVGYGESRPIADNATDEGRARNRRVIGELSYSEVVVD